MASSPASQPTGDAGCLDHCSQRDAAVCTFHRACPAEQRGRGEQVEDAATKKESKIASEGRSRGVTRANSKILNSGDLSRLPVGGGEQRGGVVEEGRAPRTPTPTPTPSPPVLLENSF